MAWAEPECFWCIDTEGVAGGGAELCKYCGLVTVCPAHSRYHRPGSTCFPFTVRTGEAGRTLFAARDIKLGEASGGENDSTGNLLQVVLEERAAAVGPAHSTPPVCLGCYSLVSHTTPDCPGCGFPCCGPDCWGSPQHQPECGAFSRAGVRVRVARTGRPAQEYQVSNTGRLMQNITAHRMDCPMSIHRMHEFFNTS